MEKTFAAKMLCAYYDRTCDSAELFDDLEIAVNAETHDSYRRHLNQYDVIYLDMTNVIGEACGENPVSFIRRRLTEELRAEYPQITVQGNEEAVAAQIERIHREETTPLFYHNEQSLRSVIKLAYFSYKDHYMKFEELPSGDGYADVVYRPKKASPLPALVIELKWNRSARGAIAQIKDKRYPEVLRIRRGYIAGRHCL